MKLVTKYLIKFIYYINNIGSDNTISVDLYIKKDCVSQNEVINYKCYMGSKSQLRVFYKFINITIELDHQLYK